MGRGRDKNEQPPQRKKGRKKEATQPISSILKQTDRLKSRAAPSTPKQSAQEQSASQHDEKVEKRRSLAQRRANHALEQIQGLSKSGSTSYGNYLPYVKALPATIIRSGLGQALAMERAGKKLIGHQLLFDHLVTWLMEGWETSPYRGKVSGDSDDKKAASFFQAITSGDEADYIRAQAEALDYLEWLKKFAAAFLVADEEAERGAEK